MASNERPRSSSAWLNVAAKLGGTGLSFALYVVLARLLTPAQFAEVAVALAWIALGTTIAALSFPLALIRFVPENLAAGRTDLARGAIQLAFGITVAMALLLTAVVFAAAISGAIELPGDTRRTAFMAAALLVPGVLLLDLAGLLTALKRAAASEILVNVARPLLLMAALLALWLAGSGSPRASTVIAIYLGASLVILPLCAISCARALPPGFWRTAPAYETRAWLRLAGGFMVVGVASAVYERIDLLVMGWTASAEQIAVYAVAARFGQTVVVAANAATAVMAPYLVERVADLRGGRVAEVQRLVGGTARTSFLVSLGALAAFALAGPWLLKLFGPVYAHAYVPLLIIAAGQTLAALFGPAAVVAALAGVPRIPVIAMVVGTTLNAAINLLLVPRLGATGAAIATASALACTAAVAWAATRAHFGGLDTSLIAALSKRTRAAHL